MICFLLGKISLLKGWANICLTLILMVWFGLVLLPELSLFLYYDDQQWWFPPPVQRNVSGWWSSNPILLRLVNKLAPTLTSSPFPHRPTKHFSFQSIQIRGSSGNILLLMFWVWRKCFKHSSGESPFLRKWSETISNFGKVFPGGAIRSHIAG